MTQPARTGGMRIAVDVGRCIGSGICAMTDPAVFDQSEDDGLVMLRDPSPPQPNHSRVRRAAELCPVRAITVAD